MSWESPPVYPKEERPNAAMACAQRMGVGFAGGAMVGVTIGFMTGFEDTVATLLMLRKMKLNVIEN